ncbi:hypothetical protein HWC33_gp20 [Microbacterium phage TinyTimothy]|uniref:Uncharacterized protein n=1 Tax=Microbacterium phage TinyTimothy TaxID=2583039 RepID=A0A4Y6EE46_9CAUD|nr:hypothetical protein HWC33_gp20 [Microbacterium phage TinyTimothy]QDF16973.1 hypothetical protein SEA_TINYTIMOTHY_20 [Microbacterium phage TinyTimothy]
MSESMFPEWILDKMREAASRPSFIGELIKTEIVEENDVEERTLLGINLEYICPACGDQVVVYNLTKESVMQSIINQTSFSSTSPGRECQLESFKFALVALLDQDQVTVHETVIIKEVEQ